MRKQLFTILSVAISLISQGQVAYSEDFDNVGGPTAGGAGTYTFPSGMLIRNVDNRTPATNVNYVNEAWERREDFASNVADSAAFSTSWYSPAGAANDFMWTNALVVPTNGKLSWNAVTYDALYKDGYEVRIMTVAPTGGTGVIGNQITNSTVLFSIAAENSTWTSRNVSLAAYAGQTVYIGFRNNSNDQFLLLIDDINVFACDYPVVSTNLTCGIPNSGSATVTDVLSSVAASTFSWAPSGGSSAAATNLAVGNYTCTITNTLGCAVTVTANVLASPSPTISSTVTNVLCNGGTNGSATVTATGGTSPYTYLASNGATVSAQSSLSPGAYTYTVTDNNSCLATASFTITQPSAIVTTSAVTNVLCNGGSGSATVTTTGGTSPYNYLASNGATVSAQSNLMPGTYTYTVTDNNGCIKTQGLTITQPSAIVTTSAVTNVLCNGGSGSATVTATGGTSPYTYLASNGATVSAQSNLMSGTYTYTVTDNNGCTKTQGLTITQPSAIVTTSTVTNVLCNGGSGSATVTATGGTGAYTYLASNGATVSVQSGLMPGSYTYTVTDANACEQTQALSITEPTAINLSTSAINGTICAGASSTLTANATGGTGTVTYTWVAGSTANTNVVNPMVSTTYTVNASDANNCASTATVNVTVNSIPSLIATTNNTIICTGETATLSVSGASTYTWSTTEITSSIAVSPTVQTTYTVDGTDANGCVNSTTIMQDVSLCTGITTLSNDASIKVYPNPNNGLFVIELTSVAKIAVTNSLGQVVIAGTFEAGKHNLDIHNESTGVYFVKVIENNKQQIIKVVKQ